MRHVLDMASAVVADSKNLQLETDISEDVPLEVCTATPKMTLMGRGIRSKG